MAKTSLYDKIIEKGTREAQEILQRGTIAAKQIETDLLAEAQHEMDVALKQAQDALHHQDMAHQSELNRIVKQRVYLKKKQLMQRVLNDAVAALQKMPTTQVEPWVKQAVKGLKLQGQETLFVRSEDAETFAKLFSSNPKSSPVILDRLVPGLTLSSTPAPISGGFLVKGNTFDANYSYEHLCAQWLDTNEAEFATLLFKED